MLYTNITKIFPIVILWAAVVWLAGCRHDPVSGGEPPRVDLESSRYGEARTAGRIESGEITESSGIAASKCRENLLWTHNDSGDGPYVFAIDETGKSLGTWKIDGAENLDWEDIATFRDTAGKCFIYIGDIGNGRKDPRSEHRIYRVAEPEVIPDAVRSVRKTAASAGSAEMMIFSYPDEPHDAETLMVHPESGEIYVVTKSRNAAAGVYKLKPAFGSPPVRAEKVADVTVPAIPNGFLTGGDVAPDGQRLVLCDYFAAYEFSLPPGATGFDDIWKQKPTVVSIGDRDQGEAVAYSADGHSLFVSSEGRNRPLIRVDLK